MPLEIACFTPQACLIAQDAGADRIEFCSDRSAGGLTPSYNDLLAIRSRIKIPVHVMIRPRAGDFLYSDEEYAKMKEEISRFIDIADGFVFGILREEHGKKMVDVERCRELVDSAGSMPCTFHRAFNEVAVDDLPAAARDVARARFTGVLTSGGAGDAVNNRIGLVARGKQLEEVGGLEFIVGGGVRADNIEELRGTGARWFHSSAILGEGDEPDANEIGAMKRATKD